MPPITSRVTGPSTPREGSTGYSGYDSSYNYRNGDHAVCQPYYCPPIVTLQQPRLSPAIDLYWPPYWNQPFTPAPRSLPGTLSIDPPARGGRTLLRRTSLRAVRGTPRPRAHTESSGLPLLPRKGWPCWVGNLPLGVDIEALKDHFSQDATDEILSVFLMRRSNCAFVNYTTERACSDAVRRFHRVPLGPGSSPLLCRPKRSDSGNGCDLWEARESPIPTAPHGDQGSPTGTRERGTLDSTADSPNRDEESAVGQREKVFILKSLTEHDLIDSRRKGTWITQTHVQEKLHRAYRSTGTVYLIFSVNKSREYYGYAKMASSPFDDTEVPEPADRPRSGVQTWCTPQTRHAPEGRIVYDPARDVLFWDAVRESGSTEDGNYSQRCGIAHAFKVVWCGQHRVPFYRVRGLTNALNGGKEVKIARDGTELELGVAKKVLALFPQDCDDKPGLH